MAWAAGNDRRRRHGGLTRHRPRSVRWPAGATPDSADHDDVRAGPGDRAGDRRLVADMVRLAFGFCLSGAVDRNTLDRLLEAPARDIAAGEASVTPPGLPRQGVLERAELAAVPVRQRRAVAEFRRILCLRTFGAGVSDEPPRRLGDQFPLALWPGHGWVDAGFLAGRTLRRKALARSDGEAGICCHGRCRADQCRPESDLAAQPAVERLAFVPVHTGHVAGHAQPDAVRPRPIPRQPGDGRFVSNIHAVWIQQRCRGSRRASGLGVDAEPGARHGRFPRSRILGCPALPALNSAARVARESASRRASRDDSYRRASLRILRRH